MIPEQIAYFTILLSLTGNFFYIRDTLRGVTRPNRVSWLLWAVIALIGAGIQIRAGAGLSVIPVFMAGFGPLLVFICSFVNKNAYWEIGKLDIICGVFSVYAIVLWLVAKQPIIAISFAILADGLAAFPTIKKAWRFPQTESGLVFVLSSINAIIGLLVIRDWTFTCYSFGVYLLLVNIALIFSIYRRKWFSEKVVAQ